MYVRDLKIVLSFAFNDVGNQEGEGLCTLYLYSEADSQPYNHTFKGKLHPEIKNTHILSHL